MHALRYDVDAEALAGAVVEDLRVDGCGYGEGVVEWGSGGNGEDFCVGAGEVGHYLGEEGAESGGDAGRVDVEADALAVEEGAADVLRTED